MSKMSTARIREDQRGIATIEMSFIIPIILIIVLSVFYSMFYEIDRSIAESVLSEEIIEVADIVKNDGEIENGRYTLSDLNHRELFYMLKTSYPKLQEEAKSQIQSNLKRRLLLSDISFYSIHIKNKEAEGEVGVQVEIPILMMRQMLGSRLNWKYKIRINHIQGAEEIRRWDAIERAK